MSLKVFSVKIRLSIFVLLLLSISSCLKAPETIKDIVDLRQDHAAYLNDSVKVKDLLTAEAQSQLDEDYNIIYFSVWHQRQPFYALPDRVHLDFIKFGVNPGFGENKLRHSKDWLKKLKQNAFLNNYPNAGYTAITTRNTSLRSLPTQRPHFNSAKGDSASWPFDNLQRSSVAANTPIFVCHISADKSWALVETSFTFGWIPADDFARVDTDFIKAWEAGRYAVITRDQTSILDESGSFILKASLGYIFPLINETAGNLEVLAAVAGKNNNAVIKHGFVSLEMSAVKPLRLTSLNAIKIANELIGEPYGWGGLYGNRDCSSMTRDFFAPFGIWLPRHSEDQVKEVGSYVNLQGLDPEQKEKIILEKGVPYLSLLWRKGHVMLYIGENGGRALIFHNIWGIKTKDLMGKEGRKIIGQAVITTLRPGNELRCIDPEGGTLLKAITAMNILVPEKINQDQNR
jgi:SH3 domain (SH3b1 type)/NLPC_P60 stabilising domain, N term/NlpC/P60 family/SH3 domain of SH3b2 type